MNIGPDPGAQFDSEPEFKPAYTPPLSLLAEWMEWWANCDEVSDRLPKSLQIRTGITLAILDPHWHPSIEPMSHIEIEE